MIDAGPAIESTVDEELLEAEVEAQRRADDERQQRIAALTQALIDKRTKAVEYREQLGIEQEWEDCEDAYEGIDDANRETEQTASARTVKPRSDGGPITARPRTTTRSTVFLNITRPYTDAAAARVADMLLPTDDRNFALRPTPIPQLSEQQHRMLMQSLQQRQMQQAMPGQGMPMAQVIDIAAFLKAKEEDANQRASRAQTRIDDWLVEWQYHAEARKVIEDCAKLGTGILKGPVPTRRKRSKVDQGPDGSLELSIVKEIGPNSVRVDPWSIYPDPSCGEDIQNGSYLFERELLSARQLRELIGQPGYITEAVKESLKEGPSKINVTEHNRSTKDDDRFEAWYFYGQISESDLESLTPAGRGTTDDEEFVDVVCTIVNDHIIKVAPSHLDSGDFPFDVMPWQRRQGMPFGIGVAKQINVPQRMLNAATRNMSDNSGLSGAPQIVMFKGVVEPADGVMELVPRKLWLADPNQNINDVKNAFVSIEFPSRQPELMAIIQFALKIAEDVTGLPMLMQGNQGAAPDTVGGMTILNNNSNTVLRRIARLFDDNITEPHMRRYYEWIMLYGEEDEKGDFVIDARGSTALVERDIQQQALLSMGQLVTNPAFGADPKAWFREMLKAQKIDPKTIMLTEEASAQQQQAQAQAMQSEQEQQDRNLEHEEHMQDKEIAKDILIARENNAARNRQVVAKQFQGAGM